MTTTTKATTDVTMASARPVRRRPRAAQLVAAAGAALIVAVMIVIALNWTYTNRNSDDR